MFSNTMFTGGGNIPQPEMTKINEVTKEFFDLLKKLSNDGTYNYRLIRLLKPMSICVLLADKEIHFVCSTEFSGVAREVYEDLRGKGNINLATSVAIVQRDLQFINPFGFSVPTDILKNEKITSDVIFQFVEQYYKSELQFFERLAKEVKINPVFKGRGYFIEDKKCFVLMPFNNDHHLQEIYNDKVKTTVEGLGFTCLRADDIYETKPIIETIWENINKAKFIIADLTGKNPNVFYELGVAHTVGKDVILLSQNIDDVPFDLRHLKVILYETTPRGVENLTKQLSATIQSITSRY